MDVCCFPELKPTSTEPPRQASGNRAAGDYPRVIPTILKSLEQAMIRTASRCPKVCLSVMMAAGQATSRVLWTACDVHWLPDGPASFTVRIHSDVPCLPMNWARASRSDPMLDHQLWLSSVTPDPAQQLTASSAAAQTTGHLCYTLVDRQIT